MIEVSTTFPKLTASEIELLHPYASCEYYEDGETIFYAGQEEIPLFVVRAGCLEIINPHDNGTTIATHEVGQFSGDIDLLTRRPVNVTGKAKGKTNVLRVENSNLRAVLNKIPRLSEKFLVAFQQRRELLVNSSRFGLKVVGHSHCKHTTEIREFLYKNFVPFHFYDLETDAGKETQARLCQTDVPTVECQNGDVLVRPSLRDIAHGAGIWRHCPDKKVDLAIVGAGPAGITAAVYAASEGLSTIVVDRLGPGGQAGGSSRIENFIGFPAGLSGNELATRGILQMLKFGAELVAPVDVEHLCASQSGSGYDLVLDCGTRLAASVVLIAAGVKWKKLEAENASKYERNGVYYACTSVEAILHDYAPVAVVGAGNSAGQAAMYLAECCPSRTVHMIVRGQLGPSMSVYLTERIRVTPNIQVHERSQIEVVDGGHDIESMTVGSGGKKSVIPVNAIFVFIGAEPSSTWLPDSIARDAKGFILTGVDAKDSGLWKLDRLPCPLETTLPGVLAAGDIRSGSTKRVGFAVGDGSQAVTCVHSLLNPI